MNSSAQNKELLRKLEKLTQDNAILDKQLKQANREFGDSILREGDTASELADLKSKLNNLTSNNETVIRELRLEVKQLKHRCNEANAELEEMKKKSAVAVTALEDENWFLKGVAETAKAAEEKAVKDMEVVVAEKLRLKRANESIIDSATVRFRDFERRVVALEAVVANSNLLVEESTGQTAPACVQETMDHAVVYVDSD
ncbi:uncharacterized protein LOC141637850 [Silene latifolia]|uniref:uncharacterized protein LOC141637850 n=1 Tax=Silene latifolia TaxID=37657 RepID=UPI003D76FA67